MPQGGLQPSDFVGYQAALPLVQPVVPSAGFQGFVDFSGIPVAPGVPSNVPFAGFLGCLDFVGYPCAGGAFVPKRGHGFKGAGKRYYHHVLMMAIAERQRRSLLKELEGKTKELSLRESADEFFHETQRIQHKRLCEQQMYTVLLAEL